MVEAVILDLNDPESWNKRVIGTHNDVLKSSPFYSEQIQISYIKKQEPCDSLHEDVEHWHTAPIEEYYLVLHGSLKVIVDGVPFGLKHMQMLPVPPYKPHRVLDYSIPVEYFVIRAPISSEKTKIRSN